MVSSPTSPGHALHVPFVSKTEVSEAVARFVREQIEAMIAGPPAMTATDVAKALGVTKAQIGDVRKRGRGVGIKTALGMARHLRITLDELETRAASRSKSAAVETRVERPMRYPSLAKVLAALEGELEPETPKYALGLAFEFDSDPGATYWFERVKAEDHRIRRDKASPERVTARREQAIRDTKQLVEDTTPPEDWLEPGDEDEEEDADARKKPGKR